MARDWPAIPIFASLFVATLILHTYVWTIERIEIAVRPLLVALALTIAVQMSVGILARNAHLGGFAAALLIAGVLDPLLAAFLLAAISLPMWLGLIRTRRVVTMPWRQLTIFLNLAALIAAIVNLGPGALEGRFVYAPRPPVEPPKAVADHDDPDVYILLLDAFPRPYTAQQDFGLDLGPFLETMRSAGFDVADQAVSNYNMTILTVASLLNGRQIPDLLPHPAADRLVQTRALEALIDQSLAIDAFRAAGYEVISIPSPFSEVTLTRANRVLDSGEMNAFEAAILRVGWIRHVLPDAQRRWVDDQLRARVRSTFATLRQLGAEQAPTPRFVFAHVMAPHQPIIFASDGSSVDQGCFPKSCGIWEQAYATSQRDLVAGQISFIAAQASTTMLAVIRSSSRPVIAVILGDHGFRHDFGDRDELLHPLLLARTPARPGLIPGDASPVNIIPKLANAYLGTALPLASEESYLTNMDTIAQTGFFPLTPWQP